MFLRLTRRAILAFALLAGIAPAFAQAPPPVPALPDTERRTAYSITASTCACALNMAIYADAGDFQNWIEVFLNGVLVNFNDATFGWTISSPSGPLINLPRPITDGILTFSTAQTGTVQIVGARRPRRAAQFNENQGVPARALNQTLTDIIAQNRETWDKINDVTGRVPLARPGETLALLPVLASRQNMGACFDSGGNLTSCVSVPSGTFSAGNGITFTGTNPTTIANNISAGLGIAITGTNPLVISLQAGSSTQAASYTVLNGDDRTTIYLTGTTANQTITVGALGSYTDPKFAVTICNETTHRWTISSADAGALSLWPKQCNALQSSGSALVYFAPFQRYQSGASGTFYVGQAGSCNNNNDGLTADSFGQLCSIQSTINLIKSNWDGRGNNTTIQLADGTYTEAFSIAGQGVWAGDGIQVQGDTGNFAAVTLFAPAGSTPIASARDYGIFFLTDLRISCASGPGVNASQFSTIDVTNVTVTSCDGNNAFEAQDGGHIDFDGGTIIAGNMATLCIAQGVGALCSMPSQTFTCTGTHTITNFVVANDLAQINAVGATFPSCPGNITGTRWAAGVNSVVDTGGGGATFFPGNVNGTTGITGAQYL
jgi:hypothetical protein